jgi:hypothetical protein
VVRGAVGVFYGRDENLSAGRRPSSNPPYFVQSNYSGDQVHPSILLSKGFPANALDPATVAAPSVNAFLKNSPTPYVTQWNIHVEHELFEGLTAQLGYVGSSAHDLYFPTQVNTPTPGAGLIQPRRPLTQYSAVYEFAPFVSSNFNSLQAQVEHRFSAGFSALAAYTWAHSIDNGSSQSDPDFFPMNPNNFRLERGDSNFDVRHRFVFNSVWNLPFGRGRRFLSGAAFERAVFSSWVISGIFSAQTGLPFTPVLSADNTGTASVARPNRNADGALGSEQRDPQHWFDTTAFVRPPEFVYGNSGRNILRGPAFVNSDLGLSRFFALTSRTDLEFRAEAFNLANTPQFGLPNAALGVETFGVISTVVSPQRQFQLALRLSF